MRHQNKCIPPDSDVGDVEEESRVVIMRATRDQLSSLFRIS